MRADGKTLNAMTNARLNVVARPGASRGRVMRMKRCQLEAPMVDAARSNVGSIPEV